MDFSFAKLKLTLRLDDDCADPYALFLSRKAFAIAFRQVVGCSNNCDDCRTAEDCPYHQTFAQTISTDPAAVQRFQKPPLPFVFDFPFVPPLPNRGVTLDAGLTLLGTAVNHLNLYLAALSRLFRLEKAGGDGGVTILRVGSVDYSGNQHPLRQPFGSQAAEVPLVLSLVGLTKMMVLPMGRITVFVDAPMRIVHDMKPLRTLSFSAVARALMRRVSAVAYYYGDITGDVDFKWLARQSDGVVTESEKFRWTEWGRGVRGITGEATYSGALSDFHLFLVAGEILHVGKGAAFGMGRFHLVLPTNGL